MTNIGEQPTLPTVPMESEELEHRSGQLIAGRYRVVKMLGRGGMGEVYLAEHVLLRHPVAVKYMRPALAADPQHSSRFMREACALSMLRHPHIVAIHDFGASSSDLYLVMEFLDGQPLSSWLEGLPVLPPIPLVGALLDQALDALDFAHRHGIVHRDIKPDNLFLAFHDGQPLLKLVDFGLVHIDESVDRVGKLTSTGMIAGTPRYMSPEQCRSLAVGPSADLYSLGCILTELLQGEPPFVASSPAELLAQHMFLPVPPLRRPPGLPAVPAALEKLRLDLLQKSPDKRPASAAEARRLLQEALDPSREEVRQLLAVDRSARIPRWEALAQSTLPSAAPVVPAGEQRIGWLSLTAVPLASPDELALGLATQGLHLALLPGAAELLAPPPGAPPLAAVVIDAGNDEPAATSLLEQLRATPLARRALVCIHTPDLPLVNRLIAAGAADVLLAPITPEDLARKLQRVLRRKR
ncbi:MAG: serine/threonine-protein kinase [Myxococcales bacterium]|nr:serine/threonine protein kinase [Polyangiaceae bacterium]MDW8249747.1 serine/threonine-protein kinase [Myxococcales bacterium]